MRVLVLHNRYRLKGGEERAVELHLAALESARVEHAALVRDSDTTGRVQAARSMVRGGYEPGDVAYAVRELGADVVHVHNVWPLMGPRALEEARAAGAAVVMHLHNYRLFCAIGTCFRDGAPCFRCRGRRTLPGLVLNCRDSLPEAAVYAYALRRHQPALLDAVEAFVTPSAAAAARLEWLGVPRGSLRVVPHYMPAESIAEHSQADSGEYAVFVGRLSAEKGVHVAIEAAASAGVPLRIAGDGPEAERLRARAPSGVELLGRVDEGELREVLAGAAMAVVPSLGEETFGFFALEAMAAGLPVIASHAGALPEIVGAERCVPPGDASALAVRMKALWRARSARAVEGEEGIAIARERYTQERFARALLAVYGEVSGR